MNLFERAKVEHCKLTQGFPDNEYLAELDKLIYVFNKYGFKSIEELDNYLMSMKTENGEKQMNKELTPLEALQTLRECIDFTYYDDIVPNCFKVIETELKDLELEKIALMESNDLLNEALEDDLKKLKALEIIKEKNIDVRYFVDDFVKQDYGWDLYDDYSEQYHYGKDDFSRYDGKYLTQEEFELLKEVLV